MRGGAPSELRVGAAALPTTGAGSLLAWSDFRRFWTVGILVNMARWIDMVLLGWVVVEVADSVWQVALIGFFRNLPMLLVSALVGEAADRLGRRRVAQAGQALAAAVSLLLGVLLLAGERSFPYLAAGAFGLGLFFAIEYPTRRALMADLVGRGSLLRAVSIDIFAYNLTRVIGPLAGGLLLRGIAPGAGYLLLALTFGAAFMLLARVRFPGAEGGRAGPPVGFAESLRTFRGNATILAILGVTVTMNALVFPHQSLLPVFARDVLRTDAVGLGLLTAAAGVGSVAGSAILARLYWLPQGTTFLISSLATPAMVLLFAVSGNLPLALICLVAGGLTQSGFSTMQSAVLLHAAPAVLRGRAAGWLAVAIGLGPLGVLATGALASALGAPAAVAGLAAAAFVVIALQSAISPGLRAYQWRDE